MSRISEVRKAQGKMQKDVAIDLKLSRPTYNQYETGKRTPDNKTLVLIANYFNVSTDYLLGNTDDPTAPGQQYENTPLKRGVRVSVLGHVAAGVPIEAIEDEVDWEEIPAEWIKGGQEYFGLKVQGDSMYPKYLEGDTVIVRKATDCESGQDCVVYVNGYNATLKTIKKHRDGALTLIPFNREYPPKKYSREEVTQLPVGICGVVVELRRKV